MCQQIINRFEEDKDGQYRGKIGQTVKSDESIKKSTDIFISGKDHWKDVDQLLFNSLASALSKIRKNMNSLMALLKTAAMEFKKHPSMNIIVGI